MQERFGRFLPEMVSGRQEIEIKDNLGIKTQAGIIDIHISPNLLSEDLLVAVNRSGPQFLENAKEYLSQLKIYMGARPLSDIAVDYLNSESNLSAEGKVLTKTLAEVLLFISSPSGRLGTFFPDEKTPFFYFDVPKMIEMWGQKHLPGAIYTSWLHEREHFIDFIDPSKRSRLQEESTRAWKVAGGIESLFWLSASTALTDSFYQAAKSRMSRRAFLKAGLKGVGLGSVAALVFSPFAFGISKEFTYFENNESEARARRAEREGTLVAPFEEIFQIKFRQ